MAGKILITPSAGSTTVDPTIAFQGAGVSTDIVLRVPSIGGLSFEGVWGQLFSISDSMSGTIYSVNDVSGIPSIEVLDTGLVKIGQYGGNLVLGSGSDDGYKFQVAGTSSYTGDTWHKANARTCYGPNTSWGTYLVVGGDGVNGITRTCGIASIVTTDGNMHIDSGNVKGMYLNFYSGNQGVIFGNGATGQVACIGSAGNLCTSSCVATAGMVCAGSCILGNSYLCVPNCVIAGGAVCAGTVYSGSCIQAGTCLMAGTYICSASCVIAAGAVCAGTVYSGSCIQAGTCLMAGTYICSASCVIAAGSLCGANATVGCCITAVSTYASNCVCGQALYGLAWVCAGAGGVTANTYVCAQTGNISTACCILAPGMICSVACLYTSTCVYSGGPICSATYICAASGIYAPTVCGKLSGCSDCAYCACCALYAYCTCGNVTGSASSATIASTLTNNSSTSASNYPIAWWSGNTLYSTPSGLCVYPSTCGMYIAGCIWSSTCVVAPGFGGRLTGCADCSYCSCCALYALCSVPGVNFRVNCCIFSSGIATNQGGDPNSGVAVGGLSLWSDPGGTTSWQGFRCGSGSGWGVHGSITSTEYATYNVMDTTERGWIWRNATTGTNHTSISNTGVVCSCNCISAPVICAVTAVCSYQICGYECILTGGYIAAGRCIRAYGCMCACGDINASGTINAPNVCATSCFCGPYYNASGYFYGPLVYAYNTTGIAVCSCSIVHSLGMICSNTCVIAGGYLYTSNWVCAASGVCTAGNVVAYNASDCNLKEKITVITCALAKVQQLRGVEYDWNEVGIRLNGGIPTDDGKTGFFNIHDVGVIAQEVERVMPEAVRNKEDGYKGVRYEKLIPLLIEAIKEQQVEIELLQARV